MRELAMNELETINAGEATAQASCTAAGQTYSNGFTLVTSIPGGYTTQTCNNGTWGNFSVVMYNTGSGAGSGK